MNLKTFGGISRIRVSDVGHPLYGRSGSVHRQMILDDSAWIRMDLDIPDELRSFPPNDERGRDVVLWPEQCESEGGAS